MDFALIKRGTYAVATAFGLVGVGMAANGDAIASLSSSGMIKLFGVLISVIGVLIAALLRVISYQVSVAVATLEAIPTMQHQIVSVSAKADKIEPWFAAMKSDVDSLRKLVRRVRRRLHTRGDGIVDRVAWLEGQVGKNRGGT